MIRRVFAILVYVLFTIGIAGETYSVAGHQTFTSDADTNTFVAYSLDGRVLADVCAVLAGEN